jgi:hypothetical protein
MENLQLFIQVANFIATISLCLAFGKSYYQEKGKNKAIKEDIAKITELVETVKHSFTKETETLKANLNLLTGFQGGLLAEERNAIIDFNEKYFKWFNSLTDTSMGNIDYKNNDEIEKFRVNLGIISNSFINSEAKFTLFIEDKALIEFQRKLKLKTLEQLGKHVKSLAIEFKHINLNFELADKHPVSEERKKQMDALYEERKEALQNAIDSIIVGVKETFPLTQQFQKMCRDYLYKLLEK